MIWINFYTWCIELYDANFLKIRGLFIDILYLDYLLIYSAWNFYCKNFTQRYSTISKTFIVINHFKTNAYIAFFPHNDFISSRASVRTPYFRLNYFCYLWNSRQCNCTLPHKKRRYRPAHTYRTPKPNNTTSSSTGHERIRIKEILFYPRVSMNSLHYGPLLLLSRRINFIASC